MNVRMSDLSNLLLSLAAALVLSTACVASAVAPAAAATPVAHVAA